MSDSLVYFSVYLYFTSKSTLSVIESDGQNILDAASTPVLSMGNFDVH